MTIECTPNYEDTIIKNCPELFESELSQIEEKYENWLRKIETNIKSYFSEDEEDDTQGEYSKIFESLVGLNEKIEKVKEIGDDHIDIIENLEKIRSKIETTVKYSENFIVEITNSREELKNLEILTEEELVELESNGLITQLNDHLDKIDEIKNHSENGETLETLQSILGGLKTKLAEFDAEYNDKYNELVENKLKLFWDKLRNKFYEEVPNRVIKILNNMEVLIKKREKSDDPDFQKDKENFVSLRKNYNDYVDNLKDIEENSENYYENSEFDKELFDDWLGRAERIKEIKDSFINLLTKHIPPKTLEIFDKVINYLEANRGKQRKNTFEKTFNGLFAMKIFNDLEHIKEVCYELYEIGFIDMKFIFTVK